MEYKIIGWTHAGDERFPEAPSHKHSSLFTVLIEEIRERGYAFSGEYHEWGDMGVPVFNSGERLELSMRTFAKVMAEVYEEDGAASYAKWFTDEGISECACGGGITVFHPTEGPNVALISRDEKPDLPSPTKLRNREFTIEDYVAMLEEQKKMIDELGLRTVPSRDDDTEHPLTIDMMLNEEPFRLFTEGKKTVELRLYDKKRARLAVGDKLQIELRGDTTKYIIAYVKALYRAPRFIDLFESEIFPLCGFEGLTPTEAVKEMRKYYSATDEATYGVIGIELEVRHVNT